MVDYLIEHNVVDFLINSMESIYPVNYKYFYLVIQLVISVQPKAYDMVIERGGRLKEKHLKRTINREKYLQEYAITQFRFKISND